MQNSKLLTFLKTFTKAELKAFGLFVKSPYFNTSKKVVQLYEYIRVAAPSFTARRLSKQKAFDYLYPNKPYKEILLLQLMSELVKLIEIFWVHEDIQKEALQKELQLIKIYRNKQLTPYWERARNRLADSINDLGTNDRYYYQFKLALDLHDAIENEKQRNREPNLQNISNSIDYYYFVTKLKYYCKALNYQRFQSVNYEWLMIEELLITIEEKQDALLKIPAIAIYYHGVKTLLQNEHTKIHFEKLKQLLHQHATRFDKGEIQNMFVLARNYCIRQLRKGSKKYLAEVFDLYKIEISQNLLLEEGKLSASTYKNITTVALSLKKFTWLEEFIYEYKWAVNSETYNFNLAQLRFHQQKYQEVLLLLQDADYEEALLLLGTKTLLLKTHFELSLQNPDSLIHEDKLDNFLVNFTALLHRRKETLPKHYIYYLNLVRMVREIMNIVHYKINIDINKLTLLKKQLDEANDVTEKPWLQEKLTQLITAN